MCCKGVVDGVGCVSCCLCCFDVSEVCLLVCVYRGRMFFIIVFVCLGGG